MERKLRSIVTASCTQFRHKGEISRSFYEGATRSYVKVPELELSESINTYFGVETEFHPEHNLVLIDFFRAPFTSLFLKL